MLEENESINVKDISKIKLESHQFVIAVLYKSGAYCDDIYQFLVTLVKN